MTEGDHCILIYILDDCSFSIMITFFFYIKTQSIWLLNSVFKFKSLHHKTQSSNKEIQETNCSLCNNFDWFTRNGTLWDEYFIQKKTYCVFLGFVEIFRWNPQHQFDWFTRNDTSWNEYFIHTNLLCFT